MLGTGRRAFNDRGQVVGDDVLASAIVDCVLHHRDVLSINGPSYRLKEHGRPNEGGVKD
jgi:DNA replication protein DnaC